MEKYSIIFQGRFEKIHLENIESALLYSDDVIVSTWINCIDENSRSFLNLIGVRLVESADPKSINAYYQDGQAKQLNIKRMLVGVYEGAKISKYPFIIKTRLDITLNFAKFMSLWQESGREFASLNVTSNCPVRFLGYPYLFCVSDWCFGVKKSHLLALNIEMLNEHIFEIKIPVLIRDTNWLVRLGAEQILCLILTQSTQYISSYTNRQNYRDYSKSEQAAHEEILSRFCNINRRDLGFISSKYKAIGGRWLNYDDAIFSDRGLFKRDVGQLFVYLVSLSVRKLRTVLGINFYK